MTLPELQVTAAAPVGVAVTQMNDPLHAKFVAWDDDDALITSFNSVSADNDLRPIWRAWCSRARPGIA